MFKAGDIIKGLNKDSDNLIRYNLLKGRVLELTDGDSNMIIEVLEHVDSQQLGICFIDVNSEKYFELVDNKNNSIEIKYEDVIKLLSMKDETEEINELENSLKSLMSSKYVVATRILQYIREIEDIRNEIKKIKNSDFKSELANKVLDELNLIKADPKCKKVTVSDDLIYIYTTQLYIEDENNPNGHFKMNEYKIVIDLNNLTINIFGELEDYHRKSYWGDKCPHPHISQSGSPCWGNTSAMLVDSMSNKDLYTTFMIVINYLESFNIEDVAGKNIKNWDFVSKDDNESILENPYFSKVERLDCGCEADEEHTYECHICQYTMCDYCASYCEDCDENICNNHRIYLDEYNKHVCESCLEKYYVYSEITDSYLDKDISHECYGCDEYAPENSLHDVMTYDKIEHSFCNTCYDKLNRCTICCLPVCDYDSAYIKEEDIIVCPTCLEENFIYSADKNEYVRIFNDSECI